MTDRNVPLPSVGTPKAEYPIDAALVRRLLRAQHPDLSELPMNFIGEGFDNVIYRLGDQLAVRIPRRESAAVLLRNEQKWLPELATVLPLPIPSPVRIGTPESDNEECAYPWHWSVLPWFDGVTADEDWPGLDQADRFAEFLIALHRPATAEMPKNDVRGVPLGLRKASTEDRRSKLASGLWTDSIETIWQKALAAQDAPHQVLLHGDLHPRNILMQAGEISAILDFGDICAGDPATDLGEIWLLFEDPAARARIIERYAAAMPWVGDDSGLWARAKGWAIVFATVLVETGMVDHPAHADIGSQTFLRLAQ